MLVQVSRVDLDGRRIDFRMVSDTLRPAAAPSTRKRGRKAQAAAEDSDHSVFTLPPSQAPAPEEAPAVPGARKARKAAADKPAADPPPAKPAAKAPKAAKAAKGSTRNARSTRARTPRKPAARARRGAK